MKITVVLAAAGLAAGLSACGVSAAQPATHQAVTPAAAATAMRHTPTARASAKKSTGAKKSAAAKVTSRQAAAMNRWYSGATVVQAANVCRYVYLVDSDNVAVNSGSGSSNLETDITKLQTDIATALRNPPPDATDAAIWKRVLNAYSNAAGGPTNSGLVAASRSAKDAPWTWTPSFGGTLLVCLNTSI